MTLVRRLYERFRQLIHEGAKFAVVGVLGLVVTNVVYGLMRHYSVGPITATTVATLVATVVTYVGNRYWSFRHRERTGVAREGLLFVFLNVAGLLIQDAVVGFNAYVLGFQHGHKIEQLIALNVGIAIATLFRFWSYRKWVWSSGDGEAAAVPAPAVSGPGPFAGGGDAPQPLANGHAVNGHAANGHTVAGDAVNGDAVNGHGINGHAASGNGSGGPGALNGHHPQAADRRR